MRTFTLFILACVAAVSFNQHASGQNARLNPATLDVTSERAQDGLNGAVRRVRVETAKMIVKNGQFTEGPRAVREITTYDMKGKKIDTVAHPVELTSPLGKEQYRYDDKGNIVETVVRGDDGSILGREKYEYEFDELGNWKKMTTSIAVYEDGKLSFEPIEVTYRTIAYYYNKAVEGMATASDARVQSAPPVNPIPSPNTNVSAPTATPDATLADSKTATQKTISNSTRLEGDKGESRSATITDAAAANKSSLKVTETANPPKEAAPDPPKTFPIKHVSEEVLRAAALDLPQPEFPPTVELAGHQGKVEVQVIIDEKGQVTSARGTSPESLLNEAAEIAARKAHFSSAKLSENPAQVFSVIRYDFISTKPAPSAAAAPANPRRIEEPKVSPDLSPGNAAPSGTPVAAPSATPGGSPAEAADLYKQGLSHLNAGRYAESEAALRQFVYRNPDDALGYSKLGLAYSGLQKYEEAVVAFKLAIKIRPDVADAGIYYRLGLAYGALKKYKEAASAFKQALYVARAQSIDANQTSSQTAPPTVQLHYNLGLAYYNLDRNDDAIKELKQAITLNPQLADPYYALGMAYISQGDEGSAKKQAQILKSLNPALARKLTDALGNGAAYIPPGCRVFQCRP
jgi:TonB family protein